MAEGYKSVALPGFGKSYHNNVRLIPKYKRVLKRSKPEVKTIPIFDKGSEDALCDIFERTEWDLFKDSCDDIDELTDTVNLYINFCTENVTTYKTVKIYPNNKHWVTSELVELLKRKKSIFDNKYENALSIISDKIKNIHFKAMSLFTINHLSNFSL